jgi:GNAT superfamily N-acetyltransferase
VASVYSSLDGFPDKDEQPEYYEMLADIGRFADKPDSSLLVAVTEKDELLGGVVHFSDMAQYGSGGTASHEKNAVGFRLLVVHPDARGMGVGKALTQRCVHLAKESGREQLIIHTTEAMEVAWAMYERFGFRRSSDLDFMQEELRAFGFHLDLGTTG